MRTVELGPEDMDLIYHNAKAANLGGASYVHDGATGKTDERFHRQIVGQIGEFAVLRWLHNGEYEYVKKREEQNQDPWKGDGGSDSSIFNVDIKTSLMRASANPMRYNLIVNKKERHPDRCYFLCLVEYYNILAAKAHIMGWADDDMVASNPSSDSRFKSGWAIKASELNPILDFKGFFVA